MLTWIGSDRVQLLYRNAKQMKRIVEAKYANLRFDEKLLDATELGFECSAVSSTCMFVGGADRTG